MSVNNIVFFFFPVLPKRVSALDAGRLNGFVEVDVLGQKLIAVAALEIRVEYNMLMVFVTRF